MPLDKKTFLFLFIASVMLCVSIVMHRVGSESSRALMEQRRMLDTASQQLMQLKRDIEHYEATQGKLGRDGAALARHEKVSISSSFSPGDLAHLNEVLGHAYETDGFLLLRSFSLQWTEARAGEKNADNAGAGRNEATLRLNLDGEKVFTR